MRQGLPSKNCRTVENVTPVFHCLLTSKIFPLSQSGGLCAHEVRDRHPFKEDPGLSKRCRTVFETTTKRMGSVHR